MGGRAILQLPGVCICWDSEGAFWATFCATEGSDFQLGATEGGGLTTKYCARKGWIFASQRAWFLLEFVPERTGVHDFCPSRGIYIILAK